MFILFSLYTFLQFLVGRILFRKLSDDAPKFLEPVGAFILGVFVSVPITYLFSCIFIFTGNPILWGVIAVIAIGIAVCIKYKARLPAGRYLVFKKENISDILLLLFSITFSTWMMTKTFHADAGGRLFVGSNNIFDFSHMLGIIRSFSWGANIPFSSPFQAGLPFFYHFFFAFYVSLWEYFGVPVAWAVNIPSILSFTSLLVAVYFLPQILLKQSRFTGWITVLLTLSNSTLTWWGMLVEKGLSSQTVRSLWSLQTYPFRGPFDGSVISIFMTLNNYINQRHLAFGIACSLVFIMLIVKQTERKAFSWKNSVIFGALFGLLGMWNIPVAAISAVSVVLLLMLAGKFRQGMALAAAAGGVIFLSYGQYLFLYDGLGVFAKAITATPILKQGWSAIRYFLLNLGILPLAVLVGFLVADKKRRIYGVPFLLLAIALCIEAFLTGRGFDQKFLSFLIIWLNVFAATGLACLWKRRTWIIKCTVAVFFGLLTVSGGIDLMPIKNEFAYPIVDTTMLPVISWIHNNTPKDAVFVSYADMIDPVAFSGRKNYYGFFGNVGSEDRSSVVKAVYEGDVRTAQEAGISYILAPKWKKNDFPYSVNKIYFTEHGLVAYEDEKFTIFQTTKNREPGTRNNSVIK